MISKTDKSVVEASRKLFWKHGIKRVTVEDICKEAGISKMTFYRNFSNKEEVAKKILTQLFEKVLMDYRANMRADKPFAQKMAQMVVQKHEGSIDISKEFIQDIYSKEITELKDLIESFQSKMRKEFMEDLAVAQREEHIRKELQLSFIPQILATFEKMMLDKNFIENYNTPHDAIMEVTNFFLYGISKASSE
ncbi:MAG: TetR/AcrR family transcriptional regulator [Flammeovirgaceae bacterium]|nr:TetR/AcrR family transcriptional regulator [Flammeovirgaceae bacterium]